MIQPLWAVGFLAVLCALEVVAAGDGADGVEVACAGATGDATGGAGCADAGGNAAAEDCGGNGSGFATLGAGAATAATVCTGAAEGVTAGAGTAAGPVVWVG